MGKMKILPISIRIWVWDLSVYSQGALQCTHKLGHEFWKGANQKNLSGPFFEKFCGSFIRIFLRPPYFYPDY